SYLTFTIKKENLQNGNAVVAVTNATGKVMWSWHLWFTPKSSLKKIPFTSGGSTYNFMTDNLGWKYTKWTGGLKREVVVKIEQQAETGEKKTATITLKQAPGNNVREGYGNLYQWGRKDPLPGTDTFYPNTGYKFNDGYTIVGDQVADYTNPANVQRMEKRTIGLSIREPGIMLPKVGGGKLGWTNHQYINLWSVDNDKMYESETPIKNGIKTIYDPSPVGFKVPDAYAFKDLSKGVAVWENGYTLKVDNDKEIYFQAGGYRDGNDGVIKGVGGYAMYWASAALIHGTGGPGFAFRALMTSNRFSMPITDPNGFGTRSYGLGVRPVAE
ncbi:MAG: fimbrillin family protein, partial [Prevotella pallens]|nr:fimbrillin family protein [Prevotella pallens]